MKKQFYKSLLPSQGFYCIAKIDKDGSLGSQFAENLDDLIRITDEYKTAGANVYVTPNSFRGFSRQAKGAVWSRSLFVDLDVGAEKEYSSQDEALASLDDFLVETGLPEPVRVNSGTGIQAFWIFTEDVAIEEWKPLAESFKQFCMDHKLLIDPSVTADASRLMRCPDTFNYKTNPPSSTGIISSSINQYELVLIKSIILGTGFNSPLPVNVLNTISKGLDEDTASVGKGKFDGSENHFADVLDKSLEGTGCAQIKRLVSAPAKQKYPEWFWLLSIASHCVDGDEAIHIVSQGHTGYDHDKTVLKANETRKNDAPQRCETIEGVYSKGCEGCPHRGKIGSPIALGRRIKPLPPERMPVGLPTLPESLFPYTWGADNALWYKPPIEFDKKGKEVDPPAMMVCRHIFYPTTRIFSRRDGAVLTIRVLLPKDPDREFDLPVKYISIGNDKFRELLASYDVTPTHPNAALIHRMVDYMSKWNDYFIDMKTAEQMQTQMGWTDNMDSFVIGFNEVTRNGEVRRTAASSGVRKLARIMPCTGSYDTWKNSAKQLNEPSLEPIAFAMLCAFGSPLMALTNTPGVSVCYSGPSGAGKTAAMLAGLSVYGEPRGLCLQENNATDNALVGRMLNLKNIMFGLDEVHSRLPEQLSKFIFQVSTGKPVARMQSSENAERDIEAFASLISLWNSNSDVLDILRLYKKNPEGEIARFVQFMIQTPKLFEQYPELGPQIIEPFNHNYGHAGVEYIKAVYAMGFEEIGLRLAYWGKRFDESFGTHTKYRFYRSLVSTSFTGGEIANKAGIIELDLERVYKKVVIDMIDYRDRTNSNNANYPDEFNTFMNDNLHSFLKMDGSTVINFPTHHAFIGRIELDSQLVWVHKQAIKNYLGGKQKLNISQFEHVMQERGILVKSEKKRIGAGWSEASVVGPVNCWVFKLDQTDLEMLKSKGDESKH